MSLHYYCILLLCAVINGWQGGSSTASHFTEPCKFRSPIVSLCCNRQINVSTKELSSHTQQTQRYPCACRQIFCQPLHIHPLNEIHLISKYVLSANSLRADWPSVTCLGFISIELRPDFVKRSFNEVNNFQRGGAWKWMWSSFLIWISHYAAFYCEIHSSIFEHVASFIYMIIVFRVCRACLPHCASAGTNCREKERNQILYK